MGPANRVFLVCAIRLAGVSVPLVVTGVSAEAVKMVPSPVQETEVTVPEPEAGAAQAMLPSLLVVRTWPEEPEGRTFQSTGRLGRPGGGGVVLVDVWYVPATRAPSVTSSRLNRAPDV